MEEVEKLKKEIKQLEGELFDYREGLTDAQSVIRDLITYYLDIKNIKDEKIVEKISYVLNEEKLKKWKNIIDINKVLVP